MILPVDEFDVSEPLPSYFDISDVSVGSEIKFATTKGDVSALVHSVNFMLEPEGFCCLVTIGEEERSVFRRQITEIKTGGIVKTLEH